MPKLNKYGDEEFVFKDKFGREWNRETLNELIETLTMLNESLERISYYKK